MSSRIIKEQQVVYLPDARRCTLGTLMETSNGIRYVDVKGFGFALDKETDDCRLMSDGNGFYVLQGQPVDDVVPSEPLVFSLQGAKVENLPGEAFIINSDEEEQ